MLEVATAACQDGAARRDSDRVDEAFRLVCEAVREQVAGVGRLHVLAEHQHGGAGQVRAGGDRRAQALVRVGRRHPHGDDRHVRAVPEHRLDQGGAITDRGHHLVTVLGEQAGQALAQQHRVVGHDDPQPAAGRAVRRWSGRCFGRGRPHGSSAVIVVGPP
jgi:hypothetical protein